MQRLRITTVIAGLAVSCGALGGIGRATVSVAPRAVPSVTASGCSTAVASARRLRIPTSFVSLAGPPFGISATHDGGWAFVDETDNGQLAVLSTRRVRPHLLRTIAVTQGVQGNSLTVDGRYLLVADGGNGAIVVSVKGAEEGVRHPVLGSLSQPNRHGLGGAIEVASSPDGRYAFVSVEFEARIAVYNVRATIASRFSRSSYVGSIPVAPLVDGLAVSPDGRWLYATSEAGTLNVVRVAAAEHHPSRSLVSTVTAGCNPTRVVASSDGRTVWVAARGGDQLLAFSASKLRTNPAHSELAAVGVGAAPVGLALINKGREIVVADSNRFQTPGASAELTVIRTASAIAHRRSLVGTIRTGTFPRELAVDPRRDILLVGNFGSNQLEAVNLRSLH